MFTVKPTLQRSRRSQPLSLWIAIAVLLIHTIIVPQSSPIHVLPAAAATAPTDENTSYFHACSGGNADIITTLISSDPTIVNSVTKDGEHGLHLVAISGDLAIAAMLLENGADPNVRTTFEHGLRMHALAWNTYYGRHDIVGALLERGADVNADFDSMAEGAPAVTVLDVVEQILGTMEEGDEETLARFGKTLAVLVKHGAKHYGDLSSDEL